MAYTLHPDGRITTDTVDELLALKKRMEVRPTQAQLPLGSAPAHTTQTGRPLDPRVVATGAFLRVISTGGPNGVPAEIVQEALGVKDSPRGMGGKMQAVKGVLERSGFADATAVVTWERTPDGPVWKPGPKFTDALTAVEGLTAKSV